MLERLKIGLLVTVIAVVTWLFAEGESLGEDSVWATVRFVAPDEYNEVEVLDGWDGRVFMQLRGPRSSLNAVKSALERTITFEAGKVDAIPLIDGEHNVRLREVMLAHEALRQSGVVVEAVSPIAVTVRVTRFVDVTLPIDPRLEGVETQGSIEVQPERATIRLPTRRASEAAGLSILAIPEPTELQSLPAGGRVQVRASLAPPPELRDANVGRITPSSATLSFEVRSTIVTREVPVPVQVLLPSSEQGKWRVRLDQGDQVLSVRVSGPESEVARIAEQTDRLVAALALSSDELAQGATSKRAGFTLISNGVPTPVPASVTIEPSDVEVRFTVEQMQDDNAQQD